MSRRRLGLGYPLSLAALALMMAWLYGEIDYLGAFAGVDLRHYRVMAQAAPGFANVPQPFLFRPLGPYFAGLLPLPDPAAFYLLSAAALVALVVLLYRWMLEQGRSPATSALAAGLLTLNPYVFGFFAFNFFQLADVLALVGIVVAFHALGDGRWALFAAALALGVLAREPAVLVVPAAFVFLWERRRPNWDAVPVALAVLPGLALFVGFRLVVEPSGGPSLWQTFLNASGKAASLETWYRLLVNAWAPLSLLPLVFWRTTQSFFEEHLFLAAFGLLVLGSALFGGDQERLVAPALVVVYPLVGNILEDRRWTRPALAVLVACAFVTSLHHLTARFPLPSRTWTIALSLLALVVATATGWAVKSGRAEAWTGERG